MSKVKLLSNLQADNGTYVEGSIIELPDAQAEHLCNIGAAELSDGAVTAALTTSTADATPPPEVEPAADPLATTQADGAQTPSEVSPATPEAPSPATQQSSSADLHLS